MSVKIDHNNFPLADAPFFMPRDLMGGSSNPIEKAAVYLVKEIARVGWDVEGVDVEVYTTGMGKAVWRRISAVEADTSFGKLRISFGNVDRGAHNYGASIAKLGGHEETSFYDDGSGSNRSPAQVARVNAAIADLTDRLKQLPPAPGHEDVTEAGDANMRRLTYVAPMPVPSDFPTLYAWIQPNEAFRLAGFVDSHAAENDYGLNPGFRLAHLGARDDKGPVPELIRDGFIYASEKLNRRASHVVHTAKFDSLPSELRLRDLNNVYVVDNAAAKKFHDLSVDKAVAAGRENITNEEYDASILATARTIVPYAEYDGSFEDPIMVINRMIERSEVRLMEGPISVIKDGEGVAAILKDSETGQVATLTSYEAMIVGYCRRAVGAANEAAQIFGVRVKVDPEIQEIVEKTPSPSFAI